MTARLLAAVLLLAGPAFAGPPKKRGKELYAQMCAICHGADGEGYKADNAPSLNRKEFLSRVSDEFLRRSIAEGRSGSTMSAWGTSRGGPLSPEDVDSVVEFLRSWRKYKPSKGGAPKAPGPAAAVYSARCERCHGAGGEGGAYAHLGDSQYLLADDALLADAIEDGRKGTPMPAFGRELGGDGVGSMVALLRGWEAQSARKPSWMPPNPAPIPLGEVTIHPKGPEPEGFQVFPASMTAVEVVHREWARGARFGILDARAPSDYMASHLAGAVSVPFYDPEPYLTSLPKDLWLVCYCACPHHESGELARKLVTHGFTKVTVLDEGFLVWRQRGYPLHTGREP